MWAVGFVILFLLAGIAALLSFWLLTTFALEWILTALLAVLSGRIVPLWFYPEQAAAVYVGQVGIDEAVRLLVLGIAWVVVLAGGIVLLWSRASRRLIVQGG